jgi:hypothetical protein
MVIKMQTNRNKLLAALLVGAALLSPLSAWAGSCCGGGGGAGLILPKFYSSMVDVSLDLEKYNGYWDQRGVHRADPAGSDLRQYRLNLGYGQRFSPRWQASIVVPYVWNSNVYSGFSSRTAGLGDTTMNLWYEALNDESAWKVRGLKDMTPSVIIGPSILIPTGISPYDDVNSSFDVTGRGFYRIDGNVIVSKTIHPWTASLSLAYGTYFERAVNREYGNYVEPYHKKLGDRTSTALSVSYIYYLGTGGDTLTGTASLSQLREADAKINGVRDASSGFKKDAVGAVIAYSSTDNDWSIRMGWNHAIMFDGWGANFPTTDIYTLGVSYGFR